MSMTIIRQYGIYILGRSIDQSYSFIVSYHFGMNFLCAYYIITLSSSQKYLYTLSAHIKCNHLIKNQVIATGYIKVKFFKRSTIFNSKPLPKMMLHEQHLSHCQPR